MEPEYDKAGKAISEGGEDVVPVEWTGLGPLSQIMYRYMGTERFRFERADNRDELLKLFRALEGLAGADLMHRSGKLIGTHLDSDNGPYMELIGAIGIDFRNACDLTFSPPLKWSAVYGRARHSGSTSLAPGTFCPWRKSRSEPRGC